MRVSPRSSLALLAALAALALPACGGDDDEGNGGGEALSAEEYTEQTEAALQTLVDPEGLRPPEADRKSVEQYLRNLSKKVDESVDELKSIVPPEKVASLHDELVRAITAYGAAFPPLADAAASGDDAALRAKADELQNAANDFQETAIELDERFRDEGIELRNLL